MDEYRQQHIVVGVSGSPASGAALSWAAEEARLRKAKLHVVRVWEPARHAAPYATVGTRPTRQETQAPAYGGLAAAMRAEFGPAVPDSVTAELAEGVPERVLVDRSANADLLVLGVTTPAWLTGRSAGPVVLIICYGLCRLVLDRRRLAAWESAWALTGPQWTTRR